MEIKEVKQKRILLVLMLGFVLISIVSASPASYDYGQDINLLQTCADCTYVNITSITSPNGTQIIGNVAMTKIGSVFNYTLNSSYTQEFGDFRVNGIGDTDGADEVWTYGITIGKSITTGNSIIYIGFIIILLFTFFLTLYGAARVRWKHQKSDEDKIISINHFRYIKVFLFAMAYFELMFLFGLSYKIFSEAGIEGFTQFFNFIYQLFLRLMFPLMIFLIIVIFVIWINNKKLSKRLKLGLTK